MIYTASVSGTESMSSDLKLTYWVGIDQELRCGQTSDMPWRVSMIVWRKYTEYVVLTLTTLYADPISS